MIETRLRLMNIQRRSELFVTHHVVGISGRSNIDCTTLMNEFSFFPPRSLPVSHSSELNIRYEWGKYTPHLSLRIFSTRLYKCVGFTRIGYKHIRFRVKVGRKSQRERPCCTTVRVWKKQYSFIVGEYSMRSLETFLFYLQLFFHFFSYGRQFASLCLTLLVNGV